MENCNCQFLAGAAANRHVGAHRGIDHVPKNGIMGITIGVTGTFKLTFSSV